MNSIFMNEFDNAMAGETIYLEWEINENPQADIVVALMHGNDMINYEFLPLGESNYEFSLAEESGEYSVYVARHRTWTATEWLKFSSRFQEILKATTSSPCSQWTSQPAFTSTHWYSRSHRKSTRQ
jgi:hypothetical protein